jgi:biofilm PGA synthesis N-glycosyltransferase PgaC
VSGVVDLETFVRGVWYFAYWYPMFMGYVWMVGALIYHVRWERQVPPVQQPPDLPGHPRVSILVPCHNEADNVSETIRALAALDYPDFEIVAINDGSSDDTGRILDREARHVPTLRVVHLAGNQGKAMALRAGALVADSEFLVCIDGDVILDRHAVRWMMWHLLTGPRVGAVTGNPRVRTRSTLLGRIQVAEFSSIIGLIKRAQRVYGRVFTVSGAVVAFRKAALQRVGYWDVDMVTEDIDISWKLQLDFSDVRYEPNALCWLLMPETLKGLWRQRLRWAQGGAEVILKHFVPLLDLRRRRMLLVFAEYLTSLLWAYAMAGTFVLYVLGKVTTMPGALYIPTLVPGWTGILIGTTCLLQFVLSLCIDARYERGLGRFYYWIVWYPMAYWLIAVLTAVAGFPRALLKRRGSRAVWTSPDRGLRA